MHTATALQAYNYTRVSAHVRTRSPSYVLYAYIFIFCICASKRNHAIASERSIFSNNHHYKRFLYCRWYLQYFGIYMCVVAENYEQTDRHTHTHSHAHTDTHTHTWNNYSNPRCACTPRVNNYTQYMHV